MPVTPPLAGQTLMTVLEGTGYKLVASSPALSAEDRTHFARMPQISDYLHLERPPRVYFSFYRLPGGLWAFGKRFARGTQRGSLNRIVIYTLALPGEVMAALEWDPWLLPACRFATEEEERSFHDLTEWGDEFPRILPDLQVVPPPDTTARRHGLLESRRRFLEERWGRDTLAAALAQALGAIEQGSGLLLPQSVEHEQLLALAWSVLPRRDRAEVPWTTHLAPGGLDLFRLANAPRPDDTRAGAGASWSVLQEGRPGPGSSALAAALADGKPTWPEIDRDWYESPGERGLSLQRDGTQVKRWTAWVERGDPPAGDFTSVGQLEAWFDAHGFERSAVADSWQSPATLLAFAARTAANLQRKGVAAVYRLLVDRKLIASLLTPRCFDEFLALGVDTSGLEAALGLCLRMPLPEQDRARLLSAALTAAERDEALAAGIAARHLVPALAATPAVAPLLGEHLDFALRSLRAAPEGLSEALRSWPTTLYDRAVAELKRWLREEPRAAHQASASWDEDTARERDSILGVAEALARGGVPAESWLPFALAEAAVLDRTERAVDVVRFSNTVSFPAGPVRQTAADRLCQRLAQWELHPGPAHRALVLALADELAAQPQWAFAVQSFAARLPDSELRAWGRPIAAVADALHRQGSVDTAAALASVMLPALSRIRPEPETTELIESFRAWLEADPNRRRQFEASTALAAIRERRLSLLQAVEEIQARVSPQEVEGVLREVLSTALPRKATEGLQVLFELVLSPRLLPSTRRTIQERYFASALRQAGPGLFRVLPPMDVLARRGAILLWIFHRMGELWPKNPLTCHERLKEAIRLGRSDAVAAFLHGATSVETSFLEELASKSGDEQLVDELRRVAMNLN